MAIKWKKKPEQHDYPAALNYLSLHFPPDRAEHFMQELIAAPMTERADKDILRAASMPLLPADDKHVVRNIAKIKAGEKMVPILIVVAGGRSLIADGYHRVCALWHLDYDLPIPCKIVWEA